MKQKDFRGWLSCHCYMKITVHNDISIINRGDNRLPRNIFPIVRHRRVKREQAHEGRVIIASLHESVRDCKFKQFGLKTT